MRKKCFSLLLEKEVDRRTVSSYEIKRIYTMTLSLSIVADVFRHEAQAKHALEALRQAGFGYDQIGIAMQGHEGIDLQSDLQNLGVSHEQASY